MDKPRRTRTEKLSIRTYPETLEGLQALAKKYTQECGYEVSRTAVIEMLVAKAVKRK